MKSRRESCELASSGGTEWVALSLLPPRPDLVTIRSFTAHGAPYSRVSLDVRRRSVDFDSQCRASHISRASRKQMQQCNCQCSDQPFFLVPLCIIIK